MYKTLNAHLFKVYEATCHNRHHRSQFGSPICLEQIVVVRCAVGHRRITLANGEVWYRRCALRLFKCHSHFRERIDIVFASFPLDSRGEERTVTQRTHPVTLRETIKVVTEGPRAGRGGILHMRAPTYEPRSLCLSDLFTGFIRISAKL